MNLTDLETFVSVVETGSFTHAAENLGVPKSTVSRRVARLEDELGVELLARKARSFTVTELGKQLHARSAPALRELGSAQRAVVEADGEPAGLLRITTPQDFGGTEVFTELLAKFRRVWPRVDLDLELTSRTVDLVEEGFDIAVRAHSKPLPTTSSLMVRKLVGDRAFMYASRDYIERRGLPERPEDLVEHDCLTLRVPAFEQAWPLTPVRGGVEKPYPIRAVVRANEMSLLTKLALGGMGLAMLPVLFQPRAAREGGLVRVLPEFASVAGQVSLVWPTSRHPSPRVRAFLDVAKAHFDDWSSREAAQ